MRYAIPAHIHGNLAAFEAVLDDIEARDESHRLIINLML